MKCKSCGADILWVKMLSGKSMPLDMPPEKRIVLSDHGDATSEYGAVEDTYVSHFATCPNAAAHRKKQ